MVKLGQKSQIKLNGIKEKIFDPRYAGTTVICETLTMQYKEVSESEQIDTNEKMFAMKRIKMSQWKWCLQKHFTLKKSSEYFTTLKVKKIKCELIRTWKGLWQGSKKWEMFASYNYTGKHAIFKLLLIFFPQDTKQVNSQCWWHLYDGIIFTLFFYFFFTFIRENQNF